MKEIQALELHQSSSSTCALLFAGAIIDQARFADDDGGAETAMGEFHVIEFQAGSAAQGFAQPRFGLFLLYRLTQ